VQARYKGVGKITPAASPAVASFADSAERPNPEKKFATTYKIKFIHHK